MEEGNIEDLLEVDDVLGAKFQARRPGGYKTPKTDPTRAIVARLLGATRLIRSRWWLKQI
jgi:hypothetical protein